MRLNLFVLLVLLVLGGCVHDRIAKQPDIDVVAVTNKLTLTLDNNELSTEQILKVEDFIAKRGNPYGLRVKLVSGSAQGRDQLEKLHQVLLNRGISKSKIISEDASPSQQGDIQLIVESFRAKVANCGASKMQPVVFNQYQSHQAYGCTNAAALAQMVANPKELIVGERLGPANGEKAVAAIDAYVSPSANNSSSQNSDSSVSITAGDQ
ncbi:CpaD family pilus assembly lipoprotein [Vibrio aquimaris]|uniref:Pilus biogenesis CpaD protein n=1 Tax=Vibrio aquimaris TaxID=2587862 RepID=A0A5P9CRA0_9VIBR|nr:CpaD family pilus assembly lipoprotein [Vibrio aquimaris]QFT28493.1 Pilus biogenesis CpaD protein [Vibrio aquimaris]